MEIGDVLEHLGRLVSPVLEFELLVRVVALALGDLDRVDVVVEGDGIVVGQREGVGQHLGTGSKRPHDALRICLLVPIADACQQAVQCLHVPVVQLHSHREVDLNPYNLVAHVLSLLVAVHHDLLVVLVEYRLRQR